MAAKKTPKKHIHSRKKHQVKKGIPFVSFRTLIITLGVLLLIFGLKTLSSFAGTVHVLGTSTESELLAQDPGDGTGDNNQGDVQRPQQPEQQQPERLPQSPTGQGVVSGAQPSSDTQVDCVNPETGQHFTTSFHDCQDINQKAGKSGFRFTPLSSPQQQIKPSSDTMEQQAPEISPVPHSQLEMQMQGNKGEINMETPGLHVQVKREDDGSVHLTATTADGKEVNLESNALDQLNKALEDKGLEVATSSSSAQNLILKQKGVEAETQLPISVDPSTHELTVTTPTGVKTVTVLPGQAVSNLLTNKVLSSVETQVSSTSGTVNQVSTLTELNNQPVFAVNGVTQKNLLGLFPVGFAKTAFVSATNGNVVQVNETLLNRVLEALSF